MTLSFHVLGPVTVKVNAAELPVRSLMVRGVLFALLMNANRPVSVDRLTQYLWTSPPASAAANLRLYVSRLRTALAEQGHAERINRSFGGYELRVNAGELDEHQFTDLASSGRRLIDARDFRQAVLAFDRSTAVWYGAVGPGLPDTLPVAAQADRLDRQRLRVAGDAVDALVAMGADSEAVARLDGILDAWPTSDRAWVQLVAALYRLDGAAGALAAYQRARRSYQELLGLDPPASLQRVHRAVLDAREGDLMGI